jgi:predicted AAA+ superfamily ATPase
VLADTLRAALAPAEPLPRTRRDARLPPVAGKVYSVIGMRRAGKTTFLYQLRDERRGELAPERALFIGFDDDRLAGIEADQLGFLLEEYYRAQPELRGRETVYWFLDEIQLVPGWERFCRRVLDTKKIEIVVSGSSMRSS